MFEVKNVSIAVNGRYLIKDLSFTLNEGDKLAIIGEEGNGKSTLLKSLLGLCDYAQIKGTIHTHGNSIGYLEQSMKEKDQKQTVYEFLFPSDFDYYESMNKLFKILNTIHLKEEILKQRINTLSGGEKVKINILRLLLDECDILFLDEPTNDLDIETLKWLEDFINHTNKPIIYVSHDETLLSNTANKILHIEQIKKKQECRTTLLKIDYNTYVNLRFQKIQKQTQIAKSEKRERKKKQETLNQMIQKVEYEQNTISRSDPHGAQVLKKKMHSLKSQEKKMNEESITEIPEIEENINFFFEPVELPKNKQILSLNIPVLKRNNKILSQNIELDIMGNTHLCIIGKNGVGKTTLLKIMKEKLENRTDLKVGYMPQNYEDILKDYKYVLDFLCKNKNQETITRARMYLGNMKFTKEEMTSKIKELSNGTKAKLFLVKFVLEKCNVLILDEPTRNLSPLSNPVIRKVLKEFQGTILSVSHDRLFINEVITERYILTSNGLTKE